MATTTTTNTGDQQPLVPLNATLSAAAQIQARDLDAMYAKVRGIFAAKLESGEPLAKKHVTAFYVNITYPNPGNQQQMKANCMCCLKPISSTGSARLVEHTVKCVLARMNKPKYVEPAVGWNSEHEKSGVVKFGVADYEPRKSTAKVCAPTRPALCPPPTEYESGLLM